MQMKNYANAPCLLGRKGGSFVGNLPIILFLLGVVFLFLGWRWQSPPNEEAMTALKGLAYLKREILRVQDQVHILEDKIQTAQQIELKESALREIEPKRNISPKYQEVLELAAKGHRIPEIAQHLLLSQDAVMMVLQTQSKGAAVR